MNRALALALLLFGSGFGTTLGEGLETDVMREVTGSLVALSTPDAARATKWYEEKLGFYDVKAGRMGKGLQFSLLRHEDNVVADPESPGATVREGGTRNQGAIRGLRYFQAGIHSAEV